MALSHHQRNAPPLFTGSLNDLTVGGVRVATVLRQTEARGSLGPSVRWISTPWFSR